MPVSETTEVQNAPNVALVSHFMLVLFSTPSPVKKEGEGGGKQWLPPRAVKRITFRDADTRVMSGTSVTTTYPFARRQALRKRIHARISGTWAAS